MNLISKRPRTVVGVLAAIAMAGGAAGCGSSASSTPTAAASNAAATTTTTTPAATSAAPPTSTAAGAPATGTPPAGAPPAGRPGRGTDVTGTPAKKASAAALARYKGTVEHVEKLSDGSYVVHVITSSGEVHVLVSAAFKVTGTQQGPSGGPPAGATGTPPAAPGTSGTTANPTT